MNACVCVCTSVESDPTDPNTLRLIALTPPTNPVLDTNTHTNTHTQTHTLKGTSGLILFLSLVVIQLSTFNKLLSSINAAISLKKEAVTCSYRFLI